MLLNTWPIQNAVRGARCISEFLLHLCCRMRASSAVGLHVTYVAPVYNAVKWRSYKTTI